MDILRNAIRSLAADHDFGPQYGTEADFTLQFEASFFNILPTAILVCLTPLHLFQYKGQAKSPPNHWLLYTKLIVAFILLALEITKAVCWASLIDYRTETTIAAGYMSCLSTLCIIIVLTIEHGYAAQSSALLTLYLTITALLDVAETRSFLRRPVAVHGVGALCATTALSKAVLLGLQEIPMQFGSELNKTIPRLAQEATAGFWNRTLLLWLNSTLCFGFRKNLRMQDLANLGNDFSSKNLAKKFQRRWNHANKESQYALANTCFSILWKYLVAAAIARIVYSVFCFLAPFLIQSVLSFLAQIESPTYKRGGLVGATFLIYLGVGLARAAYTHMVNRISAFVRGILIAEIARKNLSLEYSDAKKEASFALMTADVDGILAGTRFIQDAWINVFELIVALYFLSTILGKAFFLPAIPILITCLLAAHLGKYMAPASAKWNAAIEKRVSKTSAILPQMTLIKMTGLENYITTWMQSLRQDEINSAKTARWLRVLIVAIMPLLYWGAPIAAVAGGIYWTNFKDGLDAVSIFTTLAFLDLLIDPISNILNIYPHMGSMVAGLSRVQEFLLLPERKDHRQIMDSIIVQSPAAEDSDLPHCQDSISFLDASIAHKGSDDEILHDVKISIVKGSLTLVSGNVGSGKSLFLQSILGHGNLTKGSLSVVKGRFAYCAQKPWLPNGSIREVIVAGSDSAFDQEWYDKVIRACALDYDFAQMRNGDASPTGSNGSLLSGGQKHRVALARAVHSKAPILVLDDVLSALDKRTAKLVFANLFSSTGLLKSQGRTTIFATHSIQHLNDADQILVIDAKGQVIDRPPRIKNSGKEKEQKAIAQPKDIERNEKSENEKIDGIAETTAQELQNEKQRLNGDGDWSLYRFLFKPVPNWIIGLFLLSIGIVASLETMPFIYIRIWLGEDPTNKTYLMGLIWLGVTCIVFNAGTAWLYMLHIAPRIGLAMHRQFLETVTHATIPFLTSTDNGALLNRFSQDMTLSSQEMPMAFYYTLYLFYFAWTNTAVIAAGASYAGLIIPFTFILLYFLQAFYLRTSRQLRILDLEAKTPLYTKLSETIAGLEHIHAFGWEQQTLERIYELVDYSQQSFYYMLSIQRWLVLVLDIFITNVATLLVAMAVNWTHTTTQPSLGLALLSTISYSQSLQKVIRCWTEMETSLGAVGRLKSFIAETPVDTDPNAAMRMPLYWPGKDGIVLRDVSVKYSDDEGSPMALQGINLDLLNGKKTCIRGQTGSGKSTLALVLMKCIKYTGSILIDEFEISGIPHRALHITATVIPQDHLTLPGTLRDNLIPHDTLMLKGQGKVLDDDVWRILKDVKLIDHIKAHGDLNTPIEDMALSGGQKQLIGIARGMLHHVETGSHIVIVDEATSSLDEEMEIYIHDLMVEFFSFAAYICIAHRKAAFRGSNFMYWLEDGRIAHSLDIDALKAKSSHEPIEYPEFYYN